MPCAVANRSALPAVREPTAATSASGSRRRSLTKVLAMLPVFVLGLAAQRFLVRGLTFGAVKG